MPRPTVRIDDVKCLRETALALLVVVEDEEAWIPKSQIDDDSEVWEEGQEGTLVIPEWLAEERGWA